MHYRAPLRPVMQTYLKLCVLFTQMLEEKALQQVVEWFGEAVVQSLAMDSA